MKDRNGTNKLFDAIVAKGNKQMSDKEYIAAVKYLINESKKNPNSVLETLGTIICESSKNAKFVLFIKFEGDGKSKYAVSDHFGNPSINKDKHLNNIVRFIMGNDSL